MDLGIRGKRAIVCAASRGLGRGCAQALAREGVLVTISGRTRDTLEATARDIETETQTAVTTVLADTTTVDGRAALLAACPNPDIVVNNAGGEPPGDFRDLSREDWLRALDASMLGPIELIKAVVDGMIERKFGRIVNITSSAVKAALPLLHLSNGSRSGLTGYVAGVARDIAAHGVTINSILPGAFETDRLRTALAGIAAHNGHSYEVELENRLRSIPAHRLGMPDEFGALCAFLCSVHAGYLTAQNFLIDGGAYPGTL